MAKLAALGKAQGDRSINIGFLETLTIQYYKESRLHHIEDIKGSWVELIYIYVIHTKMLNPLGGEPKQSKGENLVATKPDREEGPSPRSPNTQVGRPTPGSLAVGPT